MSDLLTVKEVATLLGVTPKTIRRRESEGKIHAIRTPGGHRRFDKEELLKFIEKERLTVGYVRFSSQRQQEELQQELAILKTYCELTEDRWEIIQDMGSEADSSNHSLLRLLNLLCNQRLRRLVVFHKATLSRLGFDIVFSLCEIFEVEIVILNNAEGADNEAEWQQDVQQIYQHLSHQFNVIQHQRNQEFKQQLQEIIVNRR